MVLLRTPLTHPADIEAGLAGITLARELGNADPLQSLLKREAMPGDLKGSEMLNFMRDAAVTFWHETCTAKMGRDATSVVDGLLAVYGPEAPYCGWLDHASHNNWQHHGAMRGDWGERRRHLERCVQLRSGDSARPLSVPHTT
jgi:hypothetical protein